ncbi:MAG TPA: VanZ family protein [Thermoanaerobaculia bacterium]|nr:VanZ family protein [Thermoanaerobaculia bacterium]
MQSVLVIKRPVTIALLVIVTAGIALMTMSVTGNSYSKVDPIPFEDVRHLAHRIAQRPVSTRVLALIVVPIVANVLLFAPFGFLLFIALHTIERPTVQTYVLTVLLALAYSCLIEAVQYFLPTRVADINDIIWNTGGAFAGALLAHLRMRLRFEFD